MNSVEGSSTEKPGTNSQSAESTAQAEKPVGGNSMVMSVLLVLVLSVAVVVGAKSLLGSNQAESNQAESNQAGSSSASGDSAADNPADTAAGGLFEGDGGRASADLDVPRPACPPGPITGIDLRCLGGGAAAAGPNSEREAADHGITVVNLWAWWCEPCREELPYFNTVAHKHPEWNVIGVHADKNAGNGAALLTDLGVDLPSFQDDSNLFAGKNALPGVIPITVVVRDGEIIGKHIKTFHSVEEIEQAVQQTIGA